MRHNVLLVDDDTSLLDGLKRSLRREPYEVLTAENGKQALELLVSEKIDLIVSDENMPGISGTELLARVRQHRPDTIRILLTGSHDFEVAMRAINQGEVYRFFGKPCDTKELASAIRQALQHRELLLKSHRLLKMVRRQATELEEVDPGITSLERDEEGFIVVEESGPADLEHLLREMDVEIDRAARRLGAKTKN